MYLFICGDSQYFMINAYDDYYAIANLYEKFGGYGKITKDVFEKMIRRLILSDAVSVFNSFFPGLPIVSMYRNVEEVDIQIEEEV